MKIGIVGSRDFQQTDLVVSFISNLPKGIIIVSGGARGVDSVAKSCGERFGYTVLELLPDLTGCKERHEFTQRYKKYKYGHIDLLTPAQRSIRNMHKIHPMDIVTQRLANELNIPTEPLFEPWGKKNRGRCDFDVKIAVKPAIYKYIGKVVYVIDDVVTTGNTMSQACGVLSNLGIHTHGIAYILWS